MGAQACSARPWHCILLGCRLRNTLYVLASKLILWQWVLLQGLGVLPLHYIASQRDSLHIAVDERAVPVKIMGLGSWSRPCCCIHAVVKGLLELEGGKGHTREWRWNEHKSRGLRWVWKMWTRVVIKSRCGNVITMQVTAFSMVSSFCKIWCCMWSTDVRWLSVQIEPVVSLLAPLCLRTGILQ